MNCPKDKWWITAEPCFVRQNDQDYYVVPGGQVVVCGLNVENKDPTKVKMIWDGDVGDKAYVKIDTSENIKKDLFLFLKTAEKCHQKNFPIMIVLLCTSRIQTHRTDLYENGLNLGCTYILGKLNCGKSWAVEYLGKFLLILSIF